MEREGTLRAILKKVIAKKEVFMLSRKTTQGFSVLAWLVLLGFTGLFPSSEVRILTVSGKGKIPEALRGTKKGEEAGKRAALADAYRKMAKKLYGSRKYRLDKIFVETVEGIVRGAEIEEESCTEKVCWVKLTLRLGNLVSTFRNELLKQKKLSTLQKEKEEALENCQNMNTILKSELEKLKQENRKLREKLKEK